MKTTTLPETTTNGSKHQSFAAGIDIGAANTKVFMETMEVELPSALDCPTSIPEAPLEGAKGGFVHYLSGDRVDLIDRYWYGGDTAIKASPKGHTKVSDDATDNKISMGLQLFLASLNQSTHRDVYKVRVVLSHHDASEEIRERITNAFTGIHEVLLGRRSKRTLIQIDVLGVVNEGMGLVVKQQHRITESDEVIALDLGGHSTIATVFDGRGQSVARNPIQIGVIDLLERISVNPLMRSRCNAQCGDISLLRAALENPKNLYQYGFGQNSFDIQDIYEAELQGWIGSTLSKATKSVESYRSRASHMYAIGGGVRLPYIADCLRAKGFECLPEPEWINVQGLYKLAAQGSA